MGSKIRGILIWGALVIAIVAPITIAATSDYLAYRSGIYIAAGFAGIVAMALILIQPLLAAGYLPGLAMLRGRRLHHWVGASLVIAILAHVGGLWLTSPPDVIDALTFTSPTPFSDFGVLAMWGLFAAAALAGFRKTLRIRPAVFRFAHTALAVFVVVTGSAHALLIEGTMGTTSKIALCALALAATVKAIADLRSWALLTRRRRRA
ncbi:hypothetical protein SAMN06297251_11820 [Fulvimarina manganoxydans]|uniref:Ferric reductase like transmembrane component n=1 Tax=Fulvimarina manganoxydans TaxID=937218 RepID=A0A1W2DUX3_9HYPH|nr:ferric reductase [Fulvimarina manganoxydans]SMD01239.1 hypothetical protein SAMN06297251_11820 [Fulvimarina manganoxydans]